jgi:hypothetical protein
MTNLITLHAPPDTPGVDPTQTAAVQVGSALADELMARGWTEGVSVEIGEDQ